MKLTNFHPRLVVVLMAATFVGCSGDVEPKPADIDAGIETDGGAVVDLGGDSGEADAGCSLAEADVLVLCSGADPLPPECECADAIADPPSLGASCGVERVCGSLIGVDCGAAADGLYFYLDSDGNQLETCGGACMTRNPDVCQECPPTSAGWSCDSF